MHRFARIANLRLLPLVAGVWLTFLAPASGAPLVPESPEVKAAIAKGLKYLNAVTPNDARSGAKALHGRVLLYDRQLDHPRLREAIEAARAEANQELITADLYTLGICLVFLLEADPEKYRPEIEKFLKHLATIQKSHGGWGYPHLETGDTSMTQYAVLSMWTAVQAGFDTPLSSWVKVTNWLLRTQDPSGGFGYQAVDPNKYDLVPQERITVTMTAAGLGSLYLCADYLGFQSILLDATPEGLSSEFKAVKNDKQAVKTKDVESSRLFAAIARSNDWFRSRERERPDEWHCYYFYTLERMETFRDAATGKQVTEPGWYDSGAHELIKAQQADGSWAGREEPGPATSFAILFLVRSTRKTLEKVKSFGAGTLVGGRGLPATEGGIVLRMGQVIAKPLQGPAEELLAKIEDPTNPDYLRAVEALEDLSQSASEQTLSPVAKRLRRIATGESPEARAAALSALARTRDLDHVPLLIEALNDPDPGIFRAARLGLQFISRRFSTGVRSDEPNRAERNAEIDQWKQWYLSIRPDADFES